jgi:hypothetical protein
VVAIKAVSVLTNDFSTGEDFDVSDASPSMISDVLRRFDGRAIDNILFEIHAEGDAVQAGLSDGRNGWSCLFVADSAGSLYLCETPPPPLDQREFTMTICGQTATDQCTHWVIPTTMAVHALWHLLRTGERDPGRIWEPSDHATFKPSGETRPWPTAPPPLAPRNSHGV